MTQTRRRFSARLALIFFICPVFTSGETDPLDAVVQTSNAWIELRAETVRIETAWSSEKGLMESTVEALAERAVVAEEELALAKAQTAKDRDELDTLKSRTESAAKEQGEFEARLTSLGSRILRLRATLPPRLSDALQVSFGSLSGTELTPGERMQLTVSVLNRCIQFNRTVTCGDEVLAIEAGATPQMYEVIYWGLSHGYALDRAAGKAWYGAPGPEGWHWEARADLVQPASELIAIYNDQSDPAFVAAPARLMHPVSSTPRPATP